MLDIGKTTLLVRIIRRSIYWICRTFFHIQHSGLENIPSHGPLIVAANHQTYFDSFFIAQHFYHKTHYMTWAKTFSIPLLAPLIQWLGAFPVNIDRADKQSFRRSLEILRAGEWLIIFPEGGRSKGDWVELFKPGMARLALAAGVPILPVSLRGGDKVWPPKQWLPRTGTIRVHYHPVVPINANRPGDKSIEREGRLALTQQVRDIIAGWP